jgi:hypothetical protein
LLDDDVGDKLIGDEICFSSASELMPARGDDVYDVADVMLDPGCPKKNWI